ncbi:nucleotidyltransferase domain-containing protein [Microbacterium foliorum]|uniref:nucleotidyltransferase domain-containing protein n=1 Tax=Microbacterium foliorum TaxID=104336 RepID=UPI001DF4E706|nr:hypothetical protein [Microbacterium foliorum]CAH0195315.1 hypothetical protein SRABI03_01840 [Microbacterium foliorum]CAH0233321.1 hypothetical protein SRABI44_02723 [Microbacterium foliorum]
MDHNEIVRLYGPWRRRTIDDVVELFRGYPGRWWIAGGWAIEAFTGVSRTHGDIDPSVPRSDAHMLRSHLRGRLDVWAANHGDLLTLAAPARPIPNTCSNLWLRADGASPWEYDVILMDTTPTEWTYRRHPRITLPFEKILWTKEGVDYLRPEIQLLHKAPGLRPQDQLDFDTARSSMSGEASAWLRSALETAHPGHPWIDELTR